MEDAHQRQNKPVTGFPAAQPTYPSGGTATAYSYPAPPPPSYYPPPPSFDPRRANFLRRIFAVAIALFVIIGAISFILWLVLRPRLPEFSVSSVSSSPLNLSSSSQLSASWDIAFSVRNPNKKMTVDYDSIQATVIYGSYSLAQTTLPPFSQAKGNLTNVRARLAADASYVDDGTAKGLSADRNGGTVEFRVKLLSWVRFSSGAWRTRMHYMRVLCRHVPVGFSSTGGSGSLSGGPKECDVDL